MIRRVIRLAIGNPVLINLIFLGVVLGGLLAWRWLPKEEFPQVVTDRVIVSVLWPGASPEDVEDQLVRPIEDETNGVEGRKHTHAQAAEGLAMLTLEFVRGTDVEEVRDDVRRRVERLSLPEDATAPRVSVMGLRLPIVTLALTGDLRQVELADTLADELRALPGVKDVRIQGMAERVVEVRLEARHFAARGLSPGMVASAIEASGVGVPAGRVDLGVGEVRVRVRESVTRPEDLASVPLAVAGGDTLTVGDVGRVMEIWEPPDTRLRTNGQPAIHLILLRQDDADTLTTVAAVQDWLAPRRAALPTGMGLVAVDDSARALRERLWILGANGFMGAVLVAFILVLFVGLRNAALVLWGMPVAYLGAIGAMWVAGTTVNVISTFALLLVTGIIVDDAVVIVENVQRHLEQGKDRVTAVVDGTSEVFGAVASATLTTCLAFAPMLMLDGVVGRVMAIVPTVVMLSLLASLGEAFIVLPAHLGHYASELDQPRENLPTRVLKRAYDPLVRAVTGPGGRYLALAALTVGLAGTLSLTTVMRRTLTTPGNPLFLDVDVDLPAGSDADATEGVVAELERFVAARAGDDVIWMNARIGSQVSQRALPSKGAQRGQLKIGFVNDPARRDAVRGFFGELREWLGAHPAVATFDLESVEGGPPVGADIDVRVRSAEPGEVRPLADALAAHLRGRDGVSDVRVHEAAGGGVYEVHTSPTRAAGRGLREAEVALGVRDAISGALALELAVGERPTEVRVTVEEPTSLAGVGDLPVRLPGGDTVRLREVATVTRAMGLAAIERVDGERAVQLTASIDELLTTPEAERASLEASFGRAAGDGSGASLFYGGSIADTAESFRGLPTSALLAVLMIYGVLAVQFRSYVQPLIILSAVPLGLSGVILGLFVLRMDLSFIAMVGAVGLVGIVVNDSLVLVDFINRARAAGADPRSAVIEASLTRLRPILITTVTTVVGLMPLALGIAGEEPLLAPMAVSISFGLAFATGLTLVAVPVLYLVLDDLAVRGNMLAARVWRLGTGDLDS